MNPQSHFQRYQGLQVYVGWNDDDARRVQAVASFQDPCLHELIDDFYAEIERHPNAPRVITGGNSQIERLKGTLVQWLRELLAGPYDQEYVSRRWQFGWRHVEIGLDQIYSNMALSRLRTGLVEALGKSESADTRANADEKPTKTSKPSRRSKEVANA